MNLRHKVKTTIILQIILVFPLVFSINPIDKNQSLFNFHPSFRRIRTAKEQSPSHVEKIRIISSDGKIQENEVRVDTLPDGELRIQIAKPSKIVNANIEYQHSFKNANDYMEILLTVGTLKQYRAKEITLIIDNWQPDFKNNKREDWNLLRILRLFCDKIIITGFNNNQPLNIRPPKQYSKINISERTHIDKLVYTDDRFKDMVEKEVLENIQGATADKIEVENLSNAHWKIKLPKNINRKNITLIHSTENAENIIKGLLTIFALRQNQVKSIYLINTYQSYARQDKEFEPGQGISADIMLHILDRLLSNNLAVSLHYGDTTRMVSLPEENRVIRDENRRWVNDLPARRVYNLNGTVPLAENIFDKMIEDLKDLTGNYSSAIKEFLKHPIIVVSPDDGGFKPAEEAAQVLKKYIIKKYKREYGMKIAEKDINILVGYLKKKRVSPGEVTIEKGSGILTGVGEKTRLLEIPTTLDDCWIIFLDDETSTGRTILHGVYYLVNELKANWSRIFSGVVHGKFAEGLENFDTGLSEEQLKTFDFPLKGIDKDRELMAPKYLVVSNSYPLIFDIMPYPNIKVSSIQRLITFAIKKILGKRVTIEGP